MISSLKENLEASLDSSDILPELKAALNAEGAPAPTEAPATEAVNEEAPAIEETKEEAVEDDGPSEADLELLAMLETAHEETVATEAVEAATEDNNIDEEISTPEIEEPQEEEFLAQEAKTEEKVEATEIKEEAPAKPAVAQEAKPEKKEWAAEDKQKVVKKRKVTDDEFIRVALQKVERLNNYVGELVLLQTVLEQRRFVSIRDSLANKSISQLGKISKEIQDISMSMRMVPIRTTLQKMNRIVRDTSATLGKKVKLHIEGEETEIDKTVLELIVDPLVHIVRNSVDHGVESPEDRMASDKPEQGDVWIRAYHQGNSLVIEVEDNGKGIDSEKVKEKAVEKGVIKNANGISEQEAINLLFHPGFSTKEQVSEVSGRGVGMDVVKTNIEQLGGEVHLTSTKGKGSICRIHLPLTLAIIDGIVVNLGEEKYIFPITQINEFLRPTEEMITHVTGVGHCLSLRGAVLPIFDLSKELSLGSSKRELTNSICVISKVQEALFAIRVDDVVNQQQIVVKSLGPDIRNQKGFMGGSILGDGHPAFIIDLSELFKDKIVPMNNINNKKEVSA